MSKPVPVRIDPRNNASLHVPIRKSAMAPLRVGVCIVEETRAKLRLPEMLDKLNVDGLMSFEKIDMNRDLNEQGPFDVIIHKVLEWYNFGLETGAEKLLALSKFALESHEPIKFLDPIEETVRLADRFHSMNVLQAAADFTMNGITVFVPSYAYVPSAPSHAAAHEHAQSILTSHGITFPLITKPPITRCDAEAHDMSIVFGESGLRGMTTPCVAQQFVDHGSMLYKAAAVGDSFYICERPSVKNLGSHDLELSPTVHFFSMNVSHPDRFCPELHETNPLERIFRTTASHCDQDDEGAGAKNLLDEEVVTELLRRIREHIDLSLFGVDIIIEEGTGNYGLIDLNYLPSYKGVLPQFAADLYGMLTGYQQELLELCDEEEDLTSSSSLLSNDSAIDSTSLSTSSLSDCQSE